MFFEYNARLKFVISNVAMNCKRGDSAPGMVFLSCNPQSKMKMRVANGGRQFSN
jgi:hypothetical protein